MRLIASPGYRFTMAVLLALVAILLGLPALNLSLFETLNTLATPGTAVFWANITNLGDGLLASCIGIAVFSRLSRNLTTVFVTVILVGLLVQLAKYGFNNLPWESVSLRPVGRLGLDAVNVIGPKLEHYSFPSGHSAAAATVATIICLKIPSRTMRTLVIIGATLVALSRAVVGAHWPSDIAAGALLGVAGALVSVWLVDRVFAEPDYRARIGIYLFAIVVSLSLYQNHTRFDDYAGVDLVEYTVATVALLLCIFRLVETTYRRFRLSTRIKDLSRNELVVSFIKFGLVGASGFIVDISVFTGLHNGWGMMSELARGIAYWFAATWNWFLNRSFTFARAQKDAHAGQWSNYLIMCLVSFFPNWGTFTILTNSFEFFERYNQLALIAGVGAGMVFNFIGARFVIFRHHPGKELS
jgi:membrane-associated phospholipid phosphatase/putative flippase GtrA